MVSFWVLLVISVLMAVVFYRVMAAFVLPLFLAALLAVIFQPVHQWALRRTGQRAYVAATIATACVTLIVFVPLSWAVSLAIREGIVVANHFDSKRIAKEVVRLRVDLKLDLPLQEDAADIPSRFRKLDRAVSELATAPRGETDASAENLRKQIHDEVTELTNRAHVLQQQLPQGDGPDHPTEVSTLREQFAFWQESLTALASAQPSESSDALRGKLGEAQKRFDNLYLQLPGGVSRVWARDMLEPSSARWKELQGRVVSELQAVAVPAANATVGFVLKLVFGTIIMFVSLFFFFADGHRMAENVMRLIPLDVRHQHELLDDFTCTSRAVVLATLVSAFVQGVLAGAGFWVAGVDSVMLLTILTMVVAMIPFVGALSVWAPVCVWMLVAEGRTWPAVALALYGGLIVSQSDNVVKPLILKGQSNLHPLLALLSILGGVQAIGPVGIILGPLVVVFLQTLLRILHREMTSFETKGPSSVTSEGAQSA